tara:strand:- start:122 stop:400 length:279 start_codon:yes stop_codon:yes gene_type:complete
MDNLFLGISCYQQFDVATLLRNEEIIATALEESPYKKKHGVSFLKKALLFIKISGNQSFRYQYIIFYEELFLILEPLLDSYFILTTFISLLS